MISRVAHSFAYRSGPHLWRPVLQVLRTPAVETRGRAAVPMLTMCGARHLLMLEQMLYSVAVSWDQQPAVIVVSDGTVSCEEIQRRLRWWPQPLHVASWQSVISHHADRGRRALVEYATKDPFGRKAAAILAIADDHPILWCDADILFFSDFSRFLGCDYDISSPAVYATEDWVHAYDPFLTAGPLAHLLEVRPVNSGVVLCWGDLHTACALEDLVRLAVPNCMPFTEQTLFAEMVYQCGKIAWSLDTMLVFDDDKFSLGPTFTDKRWIARHYITPIRHLFWRDALALRLGWRSSLTRAGR